MLKLFNRLETAEHIIWDWNGTLLSDLHYAVGIVNTLLVPRNLPPLTVERYRETFCFPVRDYYLKLGFDLEKENFSALCDEFVDAFIANVHTCELVPGAMELLEKVKSTGIPQSVLSATDQPSLDYTMKKFDIGHLFKFIYGIEDKMGASKIHRGHQLVAACGVAPEKIILIGDTDHDLEVGRAMGVQVLLVAHGHQSPDKLRDLHPEVFDFSISIP